MKLYSVVLPYLLLVSFGAQFATFDKSKIELINNSPYQGVAVPLIDDVDTDSYSEKNFQNAVNLIKTNCKKHVWPWVAFNRFIGYKNEGTNNKRGDKEYFRKIKGMDLFNDAGALGDFLELWRLSLRIARELGSPGIMVDPECYNNYLNFEVDYLAKQLGLPVEVVKNRLNAIGAELMAIANAEYPQAVIWFTHTGIASRKTWVILAQNDLPTPAYLVLGMLDQAKKLGLEATIVDGADPGGKSQLKDLNDFKPLIQHLLGAYDYVWIYAGGDAGYDPYDATVSTLYNKALGEIPRLERAGP